MFPKTYTDKVECLESLVGIRTGCAVDAQYPFWVEDIEGIDVSKLAAISKASNPNGKDFAKQLVNNAARQMLGDIELLLNDGYKMENIVGDMCSTCSLLPVYTVNAGIIIKPVIATKFRKWSIPKLTVLANVSGDRQIVINDGVTPRYFNVTLVAGTLMPVLLNYSTTEKSATVSFTDPTVPLGQITCATPASCGCGGSPTSNNPVNISGMLAGVEVSTQYGFLPCVTVQCSYESLVCNLLAQAPNIFGLTLLYKFGELYYDNLRVSDRNNESVSYNEEDKEEQKKNYARLYWAKMKGTKDVSGVNKIISDYLKKNRADKCIYCESKVVAAYVTG